MATAKKSIAAELVAHLEETVGLAPELEAATPKTKASKAKAPKTPVVEAPVVEKKTGPRQGIGQYVYAKLALNWTVDEILEDVQRNFPTAKTSKDCIAWYKSKAKQLDNHA